MALGNNGEGVKNYKNIQNLNSYLLGDGVPSGIDQTVANMVSTGINGIEGIPYQFTDTVDRRVKNTTVGRKYAEKIFSRMPLLFLTPCEPIFMDDFNKRNKDLIKNVLGGGVDLGDAKAMLGKGKNQSKYYSVEFNYADYYDTLNVMLACIAVYMGIADEEIKVAGYNKARKVAQIDWKKELNSSFKTFYSSQENLVFYLDSLDTVSETFSNETTTSSIDGLVNQYSDMVNEVKFLFGKEGDSVAASLAAAGAEASGTISSGLSSAAQGLAGGIVGSLSENLQDTILNGAKIVFPKIWSSSSYDKSYQLDIKLRSPDHDSLSIFLNVLKPYCKLLALTLPRSTSKSDVNAYSAPFLVKASVKGMFSIDMGIISSLSVTKGAQCCWNDDGLPTQIDISLTIEDLYSSIHTNGFDGSVPWKNFNLFGKSAITGIVNNTSYQDFLANTAGLNIAQMELGRKIAMTYALAKTYFKTEGSRIGSVFDQTISKLIGKLYNLI